MIGISYSHFVLVYFTGMPLDQNKPIKLYLQGDPISLSGEEGRPYRSTFHNDGFPIGKHKICKSLIDIVTLPGRGINNLQIQIQNDKVDEGIERGTWKENNKYDNQFSM